MSFSARIRHWLPLLPLLALLGATYWLNQQVQPEPVKAETSLRHDPDSIVENFSAKTMNEQGTPHFVMSASKMLHYPDDNTTELIAPRITLLAGDRPPLLATAEKGTVKGKGDELFLQGNVEIQRWSGVDRDKLTLLTEYLHIIPDQDLLSTHLPVSISEAQSYVNAIGMELNNKTRTINLLSRVRSEYAPPRY